MCNLILIVIEKKFSSSFLFWLYKHNIWVFTLWYVLYLIIEQEFLFENYLWTKEEMHVIDNLLLARIVIIMCFLSKFYHPKIILHMWLLFQRDFLIMKSVYKYRLLLFGWFAGIGFKNQFLTLIMHHMFFPISNLY